MSFPRYEAYKDSGVEWLGEVPATWEVSSLGVLILKAELGDNHDSSEGNEGLPVMKMGNLDRGYIKLDKVEFLPDGIEVSDSMTLRNGDFLFKETLGNAVLVRTNCGTMSDMRTSIGLQGIN